MRTGYKVAVVDLVLLGALYFIVQNLQWRASYAASEGLTPSYSYSLLWNVFQMSGRAFPLQSPPTLDWVQLLAAILAVLNLVYVYTALRGRRSKGLRTQPTSLQGSQS